MRNSALVVVFALVSTGVFAQTPPSPPKDPQKPPAAVGEEGKKPVRSFGAALVHNLGDDVKHMPRLNSVYWLAGGGAAAWAIHGEDGKINRHLETSAAAGRVFKPGSIIGQGETIGAAAVASYLIGRHKKSDRLQHLGMDEIEATILSESIVETMKIAVRRDRPVRKDGTRAGGYSFPSGHSTLTFAAATVLQQHLGYKAGVPTYLIASYVAMSRLHDNVHFASDVAFGAGLGILIGRSVTWHGRNFYGRSFTAMPMLLPGGGGIIVTLNDRPAVSDPGR